MAGKMASERTDHNERAETYASLSLFDMAVVSKRYEPVWPLRATDCSGASLPSHCGGFS